MPVMRKAVCPAAVAFLVALGASASSSHPRHHIYRSADDFVWNGLHVCRDIAYGPRGDAKGEGVGYKSPATHKLPDGHICHSHRTGQFFDMVFPEKGIRSDMPVYVNLHGGAWCQPYDKDGESYELFKMLVDRGFMVINANYQLQNDITDGNRPVVRRPNATFLDMTRDIDTLMTFLKTDFLPRVGVRAEKVALGGGSAGAHLTALYAYDQDNPSVLKANLRHELRVGFLVDVVGPCDLAGHDFTDPFLEKNLPFGSMFNEWSADRLLTVLGWLVDDDLRARIKRNDIEGARAVLRRFSPVEQVCAKSVPTILAYCQLFPFASSDGCVPVSTYYDLRARLEKNGVPCEGDIRTFRPHGWLRSNFLEWMADRMADFVKKGYLN